MNASTRLKFWEIDHFFKCPVAGMCLSFPEQKQLLKKTGTSIKRKNSFEIHEVLVSSADTENPLSQKIDTLLNRKFKDEIQFSSGFNESEIMQHWRKHFETGNWSPALWVAVTYPHLSPDSRLEIFGNIHMAMHGNAEQDSRLKQRLTCREKECCRLSQKLKDEIRSRKALQKENEKLKRNENELQIRLSALEKQKTPRLKKPENPIDGESAEQVNEICTLRVKIKKMTEEVKACRQQITSLRRQNEQLTAEADEHETVTADLKKQIQQVIRQMSKLNRCDSSCPAFNLCKKRVLIVGGITKMESAYRCLIENSGGVFDYHDGYVKGGTKKLQDSLKRADMVLCPVNCNSHAACSLVKRLGKKHKKPVHMLATSSLSAVSQAVCGDSGCTVCSGTN